MHCSRVLGTLKKQKNDSKSRINVFWQRQPPLPRETSLTKETCQTQRERKGAEQNYCKIFILVICLFVCFGSVFFSRQGSNQAVKTVCVDNAEKLCWSKHLRVPLGGLTLSGRLSIREQQTPLWVLCFIVCLTPDGIKLYASMVSLEKAFNRPLLTREKKKKIHYCST